ncbi:MAG: nitroreductase, partial [Methylococcaceae bacterium]
CLVDKNKRELIIHILIIAVAMENFTRNGKPNRWAIDDTGAACEATALSLAVHQMGGFNEEKTLEHFKLPKGYTAMSMMAVGYPNGY